ncbi:MAG: dTDP-4-dehydrorhamnose reductase [Planctomycetota bacterium]|nr:dTDP-4-dehydrorhamnose reductase [Planctomycetota bacterium]
MKRVLVTGASGMLGSQLMLSAPIGTQALGTDLRSDAPVEFAGVDLADEAAVDALLAQVGAITGVIHGAAFTAVDLAEERESDAKRANEDACRVLASRCASRSIPIVVVSTDFVFDGGGTRPYREDDTVRPLSAYGRTKLAGEKAATLAHPKGTRIVRTQWLYGPRGKHFPGTILKLASERPELKVVHDQIGSPTSTLELAPALWDVLARGDAGIYHAACDGQASWFEFACATLELSGVRGVKVAPCTTEEFPRPAVRPRYSVLDCSKLAKLRGKTLAPWRKALETFLAVSSQAEQHIK